MTIKDTIIYKEIKNNSNNNNTVVMPYYTSTGIIITDDNKEKIIINRISEYEAKMLETLKTVKSLPFNLEYIKDKIREEIEHRLNKPLLNRNYIYVNSSTIDDAIAEVEKLSDFSHWGGMKENI